MRVNGPHDALLIELLEKPEGFLTILIEHVHIFIREVNILVMFGYGDRPSVGQLVFLNAIVSLGLWFGWGMLVLGYFALLRGSLRRGSVPCNIYSFP